MSTAALTEAVFYILLSLDAPLHGYGIMQNVERLSGGRVRLAAGTLYGALTTLTERGWIEAVGEDEGRRKEYRITPRGTRRRARGACPIAGADRQRRGADKELDVTERREECENRSFVLYGSGICCTTMRVFSAGLRGTAGTGGSSRTSAVSFFRFERSDGTRYRYYMQMMRDDPDTKRGRTYLAGCGRAGCDLPGMLLASCVLPLGGRRQTGGNVFRPRVAGVGGEVRAQRAAGRGGVVCGQCRAAVFPGVA